jgi:hypothetical protein
MRFRHSETALTFLLNRYQVAVPPGGSLCGIFSFGSAPNDGSGTKFYVRIVVIVTIRRRLVIQWSKPPFF